MGLGLSIKKTEWNTFAGFITISISFFGGFSVCLEYGGRDAKKTKKQIRLVKPKPYTTGTNS